MDTGEKIRVERVQLSERQSFCSGGYCLCLLSEGGRVQGKSREVRCSSGDAVLAAPGSYTFLMDSRQEGVLIWFDREVSGESWIPVLQGCPFLMQFFPQAGEGNAENFLVFEGTGKEPEELLRLLKDTYGEKGPYYQSVLACELMSLLLMLCSRCRAHTVLTWEPGRELYEQIVRYVTNTQLHVGDRIRLEGWAYLNGNKVRALIFSLNGGEWKTRNTDGIKKEQWVYWLAEFDLEQSGYSQLRIVPVGEAEKHANVLNAMLLFDVSE